MTGLVRRLFRRRQPVAPEIYGVDPTCESCGAPADVRLDDGSTWCISCDGSARNLGYDHRHVKTWIDRPVTPEIYGVDQVLVPCDPHAGVVNGPGLVERTRWTRAQHHARWTPDNRDGR